MPLVGFICIIIICSFFILVVGFVLKMVYNMGAASPKQLSELQNLSKYSETVRDLLDDYGRKGYISREEYHEIVEFYDTYVSRD